jgi:hypothetical protein
VHCILKTYLLTFIGDPKPHLELLNTMAPSEEPIVIVSVAQSLRLVAAHENILPRMIVNTLIQKSPQQGVYLFPASLPIHPALDGPLAAKALRLIASGDDDSVVFSCT